MVHNRIFAGLAGDNWSLIQEAVIDQLPQTERGDVGTATTINLYCHGFSLGLFSTEASHGYSVLALTGFVRDGVFTP
jgi:hypothetical protein